MPRYLTEQDIADFRAELCKVATERFARYGYEAEARKLEKTRYRAGMPRVNDGALLFLQTMLAKMKEPEKGQSRIAIIFNGSPLSNGDCGSGESEIRRWIHDDDPAHGRVFP